MAIEHRRQKVDGKYVSLCGAPMEKWSASAVSCDHCEKIFAEKSATAQPPTQAETDRAMADAGFEAGGNAGGLWNKLNPVNGRNF